ncbi:hypothetical protein [Candidatus Magnetobacterium casense]|uniref:Scaffolding protein n=1 Tax=Candidatus Magnetobacterium casense TaxID=1455061 RepID=A0ABS6S3L7_9BACT|nr:hypothetical protein [Candidatus Magnetobacterium casensis]MBV6343431.1 hypothetical protein [Candidatus Magnetobacterium casensis]
MTDENVLPVSQGQDEGGQPSPDTSGADDRPISRIEFQKAIDELANKLSSEVQSLSDKATARLNKEVSGKLSQTIDEIAKEKKLDEEQVASLKKQFLQEEASRYLEKQPDKGSPPSSRTASQPDQKAIAEVDTWLRNRMDETGIALFDNDPEVTAVKFTPNDTLEDLKEKWDEAIQAKANRLGRTLPDGKPAPPRSPGMVGGGPAGNTAERLTTQLEALDRKPTKTKSEWAEYQRLSTELAQLLKTR